MASHHQLVCQAQGFRTMQFALRVCVAFVVATLFALNSNSDNRAIVWLVPVMCALLLQDTFGGTLLSGGMLLVFNTPIAVFLYVVQVHFGMGYHNYLSATLVFLCLAFVIGYYNRNVTLRKLLLVIPAVVIPTLIQVPTKLVNDDLVWSLFAAIAFAFAIDVIISLLILPRFATLEILDRMSFTMLRSKEVFYLAREALSAPHAAFANILLRQAEDIVKVMLANQEALTLRCRASVAEPAGLLKRLFRSNQQCYAKYSTQDIALLSSAVILHTMSFVHAVGNMQFNARHAQLMKVIKADINHTLSSLSEVFVFIANPDNEYEQNSAEIDKHIDIALSSCDNLYLALRNAMEIIANEENAADIAATTSRNVGSVGGVNGASASTTAAALALHATVPLDYDLDASSDKGTNRLAFGFFVFHIAEVLQLLKEKFYSTSSSSSYSSSSVPREGDDHIELVPTTGGIVTHSRASIINNSNSSINSNNRPPVISRSVRVSNPLPAGGGGGAMENPIIKLLRLVLIIPPSDWRVRLSIAWHTTLLCGVGLIFVFEPTLSKKFENGQWILLAMIMSQGDNLGGTFTTMRMRVLGTMAGSIYAYFINLAVSALPPSHRVMPGIAMFLPFLFWCSVIKQNRSWSYFGSVCITTCIIMWLGRAAYGESLESNFAMLRVQQNAIGVLLAALLGFLTVPQLAGDMLKLEVVNVLQTYKESIVKIFSIFEEVNSYSQAVQYPVDIEYGMTPTGTGTSTGTNTSISSTVRVLASGVGGSSAAYATIGSAAPVVGVLDLDAIGFSSSPAASTLISRRRSMSQLSSASLQQQEQLSDNQSINLVLQLDTSLGDWRSFVRTHIYSQTPLIAQASTEFMVIRNSTFPADKYAQLVVQQRQVLMLLFSMEIGLSRFADCIVSCCSPSRQGSTAVANDLRSYQMAESVGRLLLLIRRDVHDVVQATVDCLHKWSKLLVDSLLLHHIFSDGSLKSALQYSSFFPVTDEEEEGEDVGVDGSSRAARALTITMIDDDLIAESGGGSGGGGGAKDAAAAVSSSFRSQSYTEVSPQGYANGNNKSTNRNRSNSNTDTRTFEYATDIAVLHALSSRLSINSARLNTTLITTTGLGINIMANNTNHSFSTGSSASTHTPFRGDQLNVIATNSSSSAGSVSGLGGIRGRSASAVGDLTAVVTAFEISCAANSLLYSSVHLAHTVGAVGELVVAILELENRDTRIKSF